MTVDYALPMYFFLGPQKFSLGFRETSFLWDRFSNRSLEKSICFCYGFFHSWQNPILRRLEIAVRR
jgi:hypothetical protein